MQVDLIDFSGPTFRDVDNRVAALRLVQIGLTDAAIFDSSGAIGGYFRCSICILQIGKAHEHCSMGLPTASLCSPCAACCEAVELTASAHSVPRAKIIS